MDSEGESVKVFFVINDSYGSEDDCNPDMRSTFDLCKSHVDDCQWVRENEIGSIPKTKQDVIVLETFEGKAFELLSNEKCLVVGYRCLKLCLMNKTPIPNTSTPVFNTAMLNMIVSVTGVQGEQKKEIEMKIGYMGGKYTASLTKITTHLIANCVNSVKYAWAAQLKIPVYLPSWLDDVWQNNLNGVVGAGAPLFDIHKCQPFHNLNVTTTGLSTAERQEISKLINDNGGLYSGKLQTEITAVLICKSVGTSSEKFKAAKRSKIECCSKHWVYDSIEAGYALPFDQYRISDSDVASSTLLHQNQTAELNFSMASTIQGDCRDISETVMNISNISNVTSRNTPKVESTKQPEKLESIMKKIPELKEIKRSGTFLDGCCVYLGGFEGEHRDKLCKILNLGGAIRFDEISDNVTHIIGLNWTSSEIEQFNQQGYYPIPLSIEWILESIKLKCPAPEDNFKLTMTTSPSINKENSPCPISSPLSQRGLQMLRQNSSISIPKFNPDAGKNLEPEPGAEPENFMKEYGEKQTTSTDTLDMYIAGANFTGGNQRGESKSMNVTDDVRQSRLEIEAPLPAEESNVDEPTGIEKSDLFKGLKFTLFGYVGEDEVTNLIEESSGVIHPQTWSKLDPPNYILVPTHGAEELADLNTTIPIVTHLWLEDCVSEMKILPIEYYHRPVVLSDPNVTPLKDCSIALSSYKSYERTFIAWLIDYLGANYAETMSRIGNSKKLPPSTHLICPTPLGSKYTAACIWGIHVVTHDWLIACAQECRRVPERIFSLKSTTDTPKQNGTPSKLNSPVATPGKVTTPQAAETPKLKINLEKSLEVDENEEPHPMDNFLQPKSNTPQQAMKMPRLTNLGTPIGCPSPPRTPIAKFFEDIGLPKYGTPDNSPLPVTPTHVDTPETPLGRCFGVDDPSPATRKYWAKRINALPSYHHSPPPVKKPRLNSTPLSELKERLWKRCLPASYYDGEENAGEASQASGSTEDDIFNNSSPKPSSVSTETSKMSTPSKCSSLANFQIEQLKEMAQKTAEKSGRRLSNKRPDWHIVKPEDQVRTVDTMVIESQQGPIGWEDPLENSEKRANSLQKSFVRRFMLSQISTTERGKYFELIQSLGGLLSDQVSLYDEEATHLICQSVSRNEKMLASIAAGKWILHTSYIEDSAKAEEFLNEELYEFGNPQAKKIENCDIGNNTLANAVYRWRIKIKENGRKPYDGMRAILFVSSRKDQLVRLIEAGGGKVLNVVTFDDTDATHCFIEAKCINEYPQCRILASKGVYCLPPIYLNNYLLADPELNPKDVIIPALLPYYKSK